MGAAAEDGAVPVVAGAEAVLVAAGVASVEVLVVVAASAAAAREAAGKGDINWLQIRWDSTDMDGLLYRSFLIE